MLNAWCIPHSCLELLDKENNFMVFQTYLQLPQAHTCSLCKLFCTHFKLWLLQCYPKVGSSYSCQGARAFQLKHLKGKGSWVWCPLCHLSSPSLGWQGHVSVLHELISQATEPDGPSARAAIQAFPGKALPLAADSTNINTWKESDCSGRSFLES